VSQEEMVVTIMAGGAGTRFWPLSTETRPKQFLSLFSDQSLFQQTLARIEPMVKPERILVMTNAHFVPLVRKQAPQIPVENIIAEPMRRDTAAAIALAALLVKQRFGDVTMGVLTADHVVEPTDAFLHALRSAQQEAQETKALYTFGIEPDYPATGYGYLELGEKTYEKENLRHFRVHRFKEKPDLETALEYLDSGNYLWNSGMFVWKVGSILEEIERQIPGHLKALSPALERDRKEGWSEALRAAFESLPSISIDFAVMEGAADVRALSAPFSWKDLGGWLSVEEYLDEDPQHNAHRGKIAVLDAHSNLVFCEESEEIVALVGVDNLVVVRAKGITLICPKGRSEEIKKLVKEVL